MNFACRKRQGAVEEDLITVEIYWDVICPWCYIGKRRFEKGLELSGLSAAEVQIVWKPFQLNPSVAAEGIERKEYRIKKFGSWEYSQQLDQQVKAAGAAEGIEFNFERMTRTPNTRKAHLLLQHALAAAKQDPLAEALFAAYFSEGKDIGSNAVLIDIAENIGIPHDEAEAAITDSESQGILSAELEHAAQLGIQSVPTFVINGDTGFSGAQDANVIAETLRAVRTSNR